VAHDREKQIAGPAADSKQGANIVIAEALIKTKYSWFNFDILCTVGFYILTQHSRSYLLRSNDLQ
jgi:hypothetical protein